MKGVILVAHGSREPSAQKEFFTLINLLKPMLPGCMVEGAFLQFSPKTIESSLDELDKSGVNDVILLPYFLFNGVHSKKNIPSLVEKYLSLHSHMKIKIGSVLGADMEIAGILSKRITGMMNID